MNSVLTVAWNATRTTVIHWVTKKEEVILRACDFLAAKK